MDLIDDVLALTESTHSGTKCQTQMALDTLDEPTRNAIYEVLDNRPEVSCTDLAQALERHGVNVRVEGLRRHRRRGAQGGCRCPR